MPNLFDYADYPTPEEYDEIYNKKKDKLNKIQLKSDKKTYNLLDGLSDGFQKMELDYWITEFNNRTFDLVTSYAMLMHYYNKGIPDKEWYISPGKNGVSIQYFPHFEEKHYIYLYWFGFYMDSYYTRFFSIIDTIYHLINIKYGFGIENSLGFNKRTSNELKTKDKDLYDYLNSIRANEIYKKVSEFRNNITHNYRPNQIDSGINRKTEKGKFVISMGVGNYTPTNEFATNIDQSIDLLSDIINNVRIKIEN